MMLKTLYPKLSQEQREALAAKAGTSPQYLWQLATGWVRPGRGTRVVPSLSLMARLAAADRRLSIKDMVVEFGEQPAKAA